MSRMRWAVSTSRRTPTRTSCGSGAFPERSSLSSKAARPTRSRTISGWARASITCWQAARSASWLARSSTSACTSREATASSVARGTLIGYLDDRIGVDFFQRAIFASRAFTVSMTSLTSRNGFVK